MEDKSNFSKIWLCRLILVATPMAVREGYILERKLNAIFTKGRKFMPCFYVDKGRAENSSASIASQLPSAHNNPYSKMAYFGVAYPDLLQELL